MKNWKLGFVVVAVLMVLAAIVGFATDDIIHVDNMFTPLNMNTYKAFTATSGLSTATTWTVDLVPYQPRGSFSLEIDVNGTGFIKQLTYEVSNGGSNFCTVAAPILTSFGPAMGTNSDGVTFLTVSPPPCRYLRYVVVVSNGACEILMLQGVK